MTMTIKDVLVAQGVASSTANYTSATLTVAPQDILVEKFSKVQERFLLDDEASLVISHSNKSQIQVVLRWNEWLSDTDADTLISFWTDSTKANGMARTFYWTHPEDSNTYIVRFTTDISRMISQYPVIDSITLQIEGWKA
jgi:hypothetical protein